MGPNFSSMLGGFKMPSEAVLTEALNGVLKLLPQNILAMIDTYKTLFFLGAACLLTLLAFEGYKLFKMVVYAGGAFAFAYLGLTYLAPHLADSVAPMLPPIISFPGLVAIACALLAVFLTRFAYTFMIMAIGGVSGYFLGSTVIYNLLIGYFNTLDFLKVDTVKYIVGGVMAALLALVFILLFKHIYMLLTSFGGMIGAALLLRNVVVPVADDTIKISFVVLGIAVGIFAIVHQYKEEEKALEIVF